MPEENTFDLEEVVTLDPTDKEHFTEDHQKFLEEHKSELTTDELTKFGFQVEPIKPEARGGGDSGASDSGAAGDTGIGDELDPDDKKEIQRQVEQGLAPFRKANQELQNKVEVDSFLAINPDYKKYEQAIRDHIADPAYSRVPVARIAAMIAAPDLMKIGARKEREAAARAKQTQNGGGASAPRAPQGAGKDWGSASKEEFEKKKAEVLSQG